MIDGELEYEVVQILNAKLDHYHKPPFLYYIYWAGYKGTDEEYSWLSTSELSYASKLIQEFYAQYFTKPGPFSIVAFSPNTTLLPN